MRIFLARILDRIGNWCLRRSLDLVGWPVAAEHVTESCFTLHDIPFHMPPDVGPAEDYEPPRAKR